SRPAAPAAEARGRAARRRSWLGRGARAGGGERQQEEGEAGPGERLEGLAVADVALDLEARLLQAVDVLEDAGQALLVGGLEEAAAGALRDGVEQRLVDRHVDHLAPDAAAPEAVLDPGREGDEAVGPHADRVDLDPQPLADGGGGGRIDGA